MRNLVFVCSGLALAMVAGCNGDGAGTDNSAVDMAPSPDLTPPPEQPDLADNGAPSAMYPAPFPAPPQVISSGGPVLARPVLVPVFFMGDDSMTVAQLVAFETAVGATAYWHATTSEYGVGVATVTAPVQLGETAPAMLSDTDIQTWLKGKLDANDPAFPPADANTLYVLHYPPSVTVTLPGGRASTSCVDFGGYHSDFLLDVAHHSAEVAYAVIPRCSPYIPGQSVLDQATSTASHELIEAATDPYPQHRPAWAQVDNDHIYWQTALGGSEVGDMCAQDLASFTKFDELPFTVQRSWSNAAAMAGHDPCVPPIAGEVFANAAPDFQDTITLRGGSVPGVLVPVGASKTIDLVLYSDGDTSGDFHVRVRDLSLALGGTATHSYKLDRAQGQNGERLHLTITSTAMSAGGTGRVFIVTSTVGTKQHNWYGVIAQQ